MFSTWRFERFYVRPSIRPCVTDVVNTILWKQINRFCCKLPQVVHGSSDETVNFGGQEVKGQSHRLELDLDAWRRDHFRRFRSSRCSIVLIYPGRRWPAAENECLNDSKTCEPQWATAYVEIDSPGHPSIHRHLFQTKTKCLTVDLRLGCLYVVHCYAARLITETAHATLCL